METCRRRDEDEKQGRIISLTIDGKTFEAREGQKLLWVALEHGTYIPHLCAIQERETPEASCPPLLRGGEGEARTGMACAEGVFEGMEVETETPRVLRLRRRAAELLIASHPADCPRCGRTGAASCSGSPKS